MSWTIRLATSADRTAVEEIVDAAYRGYIARNGLVPAPMEDDYGALISDGRLHVLENGAEVAGLVVLIPEGETMLLDNVAVHPRFKGQGCGKALLQFAEQVALAQGCSSMRLYTQEIMSENIALYGRIGYRETHRAIEHGLPRVFMQKDLTGDGENTPGGHAAPGV